MARGNQHKPRPPDDDIKDTIFYYWRLGLTDPEIVQHTKDHFDQSKYGLSVSSLKRLRTQWGLKGTRQQKQTFYSIAPFIAEIRDRFPSMGARQMVTTLRQDYSMKVPEKIVAEYLKLTEPEAVKYRKGRRFKRKRFWAAGVMDILTVDQHDKWKRFGLRLHLGLDPFCGRIAWLKIWWTNRNPRLIASYYAEAGRKAGGVPLVSQSDPGSENNVLANMHTEIRHRLDPSLSGTRQHRWCRSKNNVKPEAAWSQLRRQFTPGFENILDDGVNRGLYDYDNPLEKLVFRYLAIPWLQAELDAWMQRFNSSPRRADKNKILPSGIPDLIYAKPHLYNSKDFKVIVPSELFDEMEQKWAPTTDPVFRLVPVAFEVQAHMLYSNLGSPVISSKNFWHIYSSLLDAFHALPRDPDLVSAIAAPDIEDEDVLLLDGLRELRNGDNVLGNHGYIYMGGLENPPPLDQGSEGELEPDDMDLREYADFSD